MNEPCPGCAEGVVCRTPLCGRLKFSFPNKAAMPSKTTATFDDTDLMKNKDQIAALESTVLHLERHVELLINRVHILEMKMFPRVTAAAPVEWPGFVPDTPIYTIKSGLRIPEMPAQCSFHH